MGLIKSRASSEAPSSEVAVRTPPARRGALRSVLPRRIGPVGASSLATVTSWPTLSTSRGAALSIPAVKQCRDLIVGAAVQMAVYRHRSGDRIPNGKLLTQPDPDTTWARTLAGTIEDMIYDGIGYWLVLARDGQSSERNPDGLPVRARWIPSCDVTPKLSPDAGSYSRLEGYQIAGIEGIVATENVVRFESPLPAVLVVGADAIENALALEDAARRFSEVTIPAGTLTNEGAELSEEEAEAVVDRFEQQRREHGVAFLQGLTYAREQLTAEDLQLVAARAHTATEMARLHNMPVAQVAASPSGGGSVLLYANVGSNLALMVSNAVAPYLSAIEQTLSLPTVTPEGQAVAFDVPAFLRSDPDALKSYVLDLLKAEAITKDEARQMLGIGASADPNLQPGTV
jgi:hypothetical protein